MQRQGSMTGARTMAATNNQAPPPSGTLPTPRTVPARRDSLRPGGGEQKRDPMALLKRQATTRMAINSLLDVMGARNLQYDVQQDAMSFAEYDMDGNQRLDFEEASFPAGLHARTLVSSVLFDRLPSHSLTHSPPSMSARALSHVQFYSMQPRLMRERYTPAEIRELFQAADANGDGSVSVNEVHETPPVLPKKLRGQHPLLVARVLTCIVPPAPLRFSSSNGPRPMLRRRMARLRFARPFGNSTLMARVKSPPPSLSPPRPNWDSLRTRATSFVSSMRTAVRRYPTMSSARRWPKDRPPTCTPSSC